jgi:ribosomal protein S18 acetylase RimI-like enzyme
MMTIKIALRPATLADAKQLARLWVATFPDKFGPILGEKAEPVLCDWLRLSQRHLGTTTIAELGDEFAGFIVLETPAAPPVDDGRWLWHALQLNNGIFGALRGLVLMSLVDTQHPINPREIYIEMLGVDPAWRGQGVGSCLIQHAENMARQQGATQLTLAVASDNTPAIHLYGKMGFKVETERRSRLLKWITGHPGYYEMVKRVDRRGGDDEAMRR